MVNIDGIDPELTQKFADALERLWPAEDRKGPLGLAVSGGPDSLALLLLAYAAMPGEVAVMSIDHGLRVVPLGVRQQKQPLADSAETPNVDSK